MMYENQSVQTTEICNTTRNIERAVLYAFQAHSAFYSTINSLYHLKNAVEIKHDIKNNFTS